MHLIQDMGYVCYGVRDLERAVDFYRNVCQLEVTERSGDTVFLSGDMRHHWVRLERRDEPGLIRLGYRAVDPAAIDEIAGRLEGMGISTERRDEPVADRVRDALRFRSPDGIDFEVYDRMLTLPASPAPARGIALLLHAVVGVADVSASRDFYADTLGLLVSDQIEEVVVFLRAANRYHHSLALARGGPGQLDHVAMLVEDIEDVLRFRAHGLRRGFLVDDLVKHVASSSVSVYLADPADGISVEYCNGHGQIDDDSYRGRLLKAGPTTVNGFSAGFPDRPLPAAPPPAAAAHTGGTAAALAAALTPETVDVG